MAFEVGEVHGGKMKLEEAVLPCGVAAGLEPVLVLINDQKFTKTANCWGVDNMAKGTNTNRIVVFQKRVDGRAAPCAVGLPGQRARGLTAFAAGKREGVTGVLPVA